MAHVTWEIYFASFIKVLLSNLGPIIKVVFNKINMNLLIIIRIAKLN